MREAFVGSVMSDLVTDGIVARDSSVLTVCAAQAEHDLFRRLGFTDVTISNLDPRAGNGDYSPFAWSYQDAMDLSYDDESFDFAMVCDGLHHCSSPHRALLEMYRVARRGVIVVESRDNALMRLAVRLGLTDDYEVVSVAYHQGEFGGVNNTEIPNHVYRWTEREFEKTIRSNDPAGRHTFLYRYGFNPPAAAHRGPAVQGAVRGASWLLRNVAPRIAKRQGNTFAMVALKPRLPQDLWPWLHLEHGVVRYGAAR